VIADILARAVGGQLTRRFRPVRWFDNQIIRTAETVLARDGRNIAAVRGEPHAFEFRATEEIRRCGHARIVCGGADIRGQKCHRKQNTGKESKMQTHAFAGRTVTGRARISGFVDHRCRA